jgi:FemAB-related protein (PEP-CTERM system-associated)
MNAELQVRASRLSAFPLKDYNDYIASQPNATPYHYSGWLIAVKKAYGHAAWVVTAHQNGKLCGALPLVEVKRPFRSSTLVSLPFCDLGGLLADSRDIAGEIRFAAQNLAASLGGAALEIREGGPELLPEECIDLAGDTKVRMLCELPACSETLFKSYKPKLRSQIRKAEKNGLTAEVRQGDDAIALFYAVFSRNMLRLGSPVHSLSWFKELGRAYGDKMLVGLVFKDQEPVGGGIVLVQGEQACIPWASTLEEYNKLAPNMLLYWTLLAKVNDLGCTQFDFGRSTLGEGTFRFKKQWGAVPHHLFWRNESQTNERENSSSSSILSSNLSRTVSRLRPLIERIWQRFPLPVANWIGPKLRRYITL